MAELNVPPDEQAALEVLDKEEVARLIAQAIREERSDDLRRLHLENCGS